VCDKGGVGAYHDGSYPFERPSPVLSAGREVGKSAGREVNKERRYKWLSLSPH